MTARRRGVFFLLLSLTTLLLSPPTTPAEPLGPTARPPEPPPKPAAVSGGVDADVVFHDGSLLKLQILDDELEVRTRYGPLRVPVASVQRVEFGLCVADDERTAIDSAVKELLGTVPARRETAKSALRGFGPKAVPALRRAAKAAGEESVAHVHTLLGDMAPGRGDADPRDCDTVVTEDCQLSGRVTARTLRVRTTQFGEQQLSLATVRGIEVGGSGSLAADTAPAEEAPANLAQYAGRRGQTLRFRVTAGTGGTVWGTSVHTLDSHLATAVIHAGLLQPGQTGVVRVRMVDSPPSFNGSTQNGITSHPYGHYPQGAYELVRSGRR